jgi:hypothetical protein
LSNIDNINLGIEFSPPIPPTTANSGTKTGIADSVDPNAKSGPSGADTSGYIKPDGAFSYRIDFENESTASAPAQQVVIKDNLNVNLDWNTFQLTEVGFGDHLISIPANSQHFETAVLVSYNGVSFEAQFSAGIDVSTGTITASFYSIDPATGLPPSVNIGFLPPENNTGRGMGHVSYTIQPKDGLAAGAEIRNVALISFDGQPQIATNQIDPHDPAKGIDPAKECLNTIVYEINTATQLASSLNPTAYGQPVSFNATVSSAPPFTVTPTGTVTFKDGDTTLGTVSLNSSGQTIFSTGNLTVGSHGITAVYAGDSLFTGSTSSVITQTVQGTSVTNVTIMVAFQGSTRPDSGWIVPLTVKFFTPGATAPVDVLTAEPVYTFTLTTAKSGDMAVAQAGDVTPGTYDITATSDHCLCNVKRGVVIAASATDVNMGILLEGDADGNHKVNILDFGLLAATYGKQRGQTGFDERADFNRTNNISILDFGLLAANYGKHCPVEIR